jgi:hypothetical protein
MSWWNFAAAAEDTRGEPEEVEPTGEIDALMDPVLALLARLARSESSATLISLSNPASVVVEFVRAQGNRVTLRVADPTVRTMQVFGPLSCALLVYVNGKNANIVMGSVIREPTMVNGQWLVLLEMGEKLLRADARRTYRVPVTEDSALLAVVRGPSGAKVQIAADDISLGGLGGVLRDAPPGAFPLGSSVQVALKCGAHRVCLDAEVRFRRRARIGLFFPGVWHRDGLEAPSELRAIVRSVEMVWIRNRESSSVLSVGAAEE